MSQSQAQASCGPAHPTGSAASRHQQNGSGTKQRPAGVHHVLRQSSPPDALRTLSRQRNANRIRRHRGRMQNSGQTTVVLLGNALDPRGRSNHPQPASPRPHRKPVAPVLAKNQPVWCSRPSKTLITGRTHDMRGSPPISLAQKTGTIADFPIPHRGGAYNHHSDELEIPTNIILHLLPPYSPELNPQENLWDEIREKIFKNYALKSMDDVNAKLDEAAFYIERNPTLVRSITSFPYIAKSL